jgi:hypothetical protein
MRLHKILIACSVVVLLGSCKKWLDINEDPANPQVATGEVLISPIQAAMANNIIRDSRFVGKYVQFWGNVGVGDVWERHGYVSDITDVSGDIWRMVYFNLGRNLELMIEDGIKNQKYGFAGIGYAIKAWAYQVGTDYHGPMILDQVFDDERYVFDYNDQPDVYVKVREYAALAIEYLDKPGGIDIRPVLAGTSGDQIYKGDYSRWKKFVYGLLALQYSHLRAKAEFKNSYADSVIKYADLSFTSSADDALVFHNASVIAENNPLNLLTNTTAYRTGYPIVALLSGGVRGTPRQDTVRNLTTGVTTSADPRLFRMINHSPDSAYRGVVATDGDPNSANKRAVGGLTGKFVFHDKASYPLMSYAQIQFAKSEAAFVKGLSTPAYDAYLNGIRGHMDFVNRVNASWASTMPPITPAQVTSYLASSEVAKNGGELTLQDIMLQKYIAQWGWAAIEQWTDLRKYRYDQALFKHYYVLVGSDIWPENNQKLVQRVRPRFNSEYVWNRATLAKFGALDPDYHTDELWFSMP